MPAPAMRPALHPPRWKIALALSAIYGFWGTAFLAMHYGMRSFPPLLLAGARLVIAGVLLLGWAALRGERPQRRHWAPALAAGALLFLGGHGLLYWGQPRITTGLAAVLYATVPIFVVLLEAARPQGSRVGAATWWGLLLGAAGIAGLVSPASLFGPGGLDRAGAAAVLGGGFFWAAGLVYCARAGRRQGLPSSAALAAGMEMVCGGLLLLSVAWALGETAGFRPAAVVLPAWLGLGYLVVFASMVAFSCFLWLLRALTPSTLSTYAYINPVVALAAGWVAIGERLSGRSAAAVALLLAAVVLIVRWGPAGEPAPGALGVE